MRARRESDEHYLIDLCDEIFGIIGKRGHRFPFLLGDPGKRPPVRLPVDAFYEELKLVVEYGERQHYETIVHFDKPHRMTVSGVHRGEQRRRYDKRRQEVLPENGLTLVVLRYDEFPNERGRLRRIRSEDLKIIRRKLAHFLPRVQPPA